MSWLTRTLPIEFRKVETGKILLSILFAGLVIHLFSYASIPDDFDEYVKDNIRVYSTNNMALWFGLLYPITIILATWFIVSPEEDAESAMFYSSYRLKWAHVFLAKLSVLIYICLGIALINYALNALFLTKINNFEYNDILENELIRTCHKYLQAFFSGVLLSSFSFLMFSIIRSAKGYLITSLFLLILCIPIVMEKNIAVLPYSLQLYVQINDVESWKVVTFSLLFSVGLIPLTTFLYLRRSRNL
ncbi:hypothetical protein [Neolewinella agarilytica]|uniref:ABC-2 family transporter protein n=1 Tax=Neolewinella agarilytica TaxID=478744 RepID=A0A1H9AUA8_9BACT|nr:hypothetical protein [Neolewinella agarilytica]SEP80081.1 hypothetical protein SAMN05444359_102224 [Neolewinella agarilytica]